jgi:aspartate kinase
MIVMKFGGTSVGSGESIANVCKLVKSRLPRNPLVVTSAHSGITNLLVAAAEEALEGNPDVSKIEKRQLEVVNELGVDESLVRKQLDTLSDLLKGISMVEELTPRTFDMVMSFGERMSAPVLAAAFRKEGINAVAKVSYDLGLRTDDRFGQANPDSNSYHEVAKQVRDIEADVIVTTGFIAKSPDGHITTLGRSGSDYSATIFGAAIDAEEVEIWTDVNGVMTADPGICPNAKSLPQLSFNEASELAWYGAKVLHPSSILPAVKKGIPVRVLNTMQPENPGTVILEKTDENAVAKSVVYKENLKLVNIMSSRMLMSHGFMAKVFSIFEKHEIVINMIATAEVVISLTTDAPIEKLQKAEEDLRQYGDVSIHDDHALVCVVGEGMAGVKGTAGRTFKALADADVNVNMISQGAREINIAVLIKDDDIEKAVLTLHKVFFE